MCIPNSANCVSKTQRITVQEGALAQFNIQAPKTSIVGMLTPIRITAQDAYQNPVTRTPVSYLVSVSSGKFLHEGGYKTSFTTNSFKNLNFYYQAAPLEGNAQNGNATIIITPADTNDTTSATGQLIQPIINAKPHLTINAKAVSSSGLTFTLPEKDDLYTTGTNNLKQFNLRSSQLQTVNLKILNSATNQPVAVDSDIRVSSANKLITIGTTGTKVITATTPKSNQLIFKQQGLFTLTTGQLSFYFYSNKKAGNDTLKVEIP
ncbi:MAG: hypothetical protein LBP53_08520 [Candidatus Peribacteria bacterium]|jgi:hypothetical protein|nr:hypothetical protein [Candidatus Peribacteria bacterium]